MNLVGERRSEQRFMDGSETDVRLIDGRSVLGRILDVSFIGVQLWTLEALSQGQHVTCRVQFARHSTNLPLRIVWARPAADGFICGAVYDPLFVFSSRLIECYRIYRVRRKQRDLEALMAV